CSTQIYTLSLHDALPICGEACAHQAVLALAEKFDALRAAARLLPLALQEKARALEHARVVERVVLQPRAEEAVDAALQPHAALRSEEHTSELQSPCNLVC